MAVVITMMVSDEELSEIAKNIGTTHTKTLLKHVAGDGHFLKAQRASTTLPGFSEIELVLDYDIRKELRKLGVLS